MRSYTSTRSIPSLLRINWSEAIITLMLEEQVANYTLRIPHYWRCSYSLLYGHMPKFVLTKIEPPDELRLLIDLAMNRFLS
jgi:hypothetical protein